MATYETIATNQVDNLQLDEMPFVQYAVTIKSGENLTRGELVGKITANGKYIKWTSGAKRRVTNRCRRVLEMHW